MHIFLCLVVLFFTKVSYADSIEFSANNQVDVDGQLELKLTQNTPNASFRVRPIVDRGIVYIKSASGAWVNGNDVWTNLPVVSKNILLRFAPATFRTVLLQFELQSVTDGNVLETNSVQIESPIKKTEYISQLNDIIMQQEQSDSVTATAARTQQQTSASTGNPRLLSTLFLGVFVLASLGLYLAVKAPEDV